ncbi:flagellar export protein FliJ [Enterobacter cancerogenus]|uniref:flagellar export protein FliJ n=1 Tax=Enterobacter mori TaxID=539813 RepID=UPI0009B1E860|nr:flagellar export protein FliJ [Enterobacter mori]MCT6663576.1 flagellar export protein FliJ [Enterobacter mori]OQD48723.1 flagellar export protein FliJ [Enterobacter cancerogenus]
MKVNNPMTLLRDMAEETLTETTRALGGVQQQLQQAVTQHEQLQHYEQEYQQSLRQGMMGNGMSVADLVNHQSFILSLKQVVKQQQGHVDACEKAVDKVKQNWVQNKQRLNAFETLIDRRATAQALVQRRHEQKLMDEFAQRAGQKRERL